jgi:hypothetical protein
MCAGSTNCIDLGTVDNCGACGNKCAVGDTCKSGKCFCANGGLDCGGSCVNNQFDPLNCGTCGNQCDHEHACNLGDCECRPPLTAIAGGCFDIQHDPNHCGTGNMVCGTGEVCGTASATTGCVAQAVCTTLTGVVCNGGCYGPLDFNTDQYNCGICGNVCAPTQICAGGNCVDFAVPLSCDATTCTGGQTCCPFPGIANDTVCLFNSSCAG